MSKKQIAMYREKVKSIGISILGGNSGIEGKYELGIDSIRFVNEEDAVGSVPSTSSFILPHIFVDIFAVLIRGWVYRFFIRVSV